MAIDAGVAIGAPVMGLIADNISFDWAYRIASALAIVALLIYICNVSEKSHARRHAKRI
jgi:predicted MFS family arabinose efflux permease